MLGDAAGRNVLHVAAERLHELVQRGFAAFKFSTRYDVCTSHRLDCQADPRQPIASALAIHAPLFAPYWNHRRYGDELIWAARSSGDHLRICGIPSRPFSSKKRLIAVNFRCRQGTTRPRRLRISGSSRNCCSRSVSPSHRRYGADSGQVAVHRPRMRSTDPSNLRTWQTPWQTH